jgi:PAS domain S-box-containing protein
MEKITIGTYVEVTVIGFMAVLLYLTSQSNYLLFHSLIELFSIVIGFSIFVITWTSRRIIDNNYLRFIGIASLFIAIIDLIHTLGYAGMGVFQGGGGNLSTSLWISARSVQAISLLIAPLLIRKKINNASLFIGYTAVTSLLLGSIFIWNVFPTAYIDGVGLTPFKINSEYIICIILLGSLILLVQKRKEFSSKVYRLLIASIILTIGSELAFTFYISVFGLFNTIGHFFKLMEFYLIYKAIIQTAITKPYNVIFRNLKQSEEKLRSIFSSSSNAITVTDLNGKVIDCNQETLEIYGFSSKEEVIGRNAFTFISKKDKIKAMQNMKKTLQKGQVKDVEYTLMTKDGREFPAEISVNVIKDYSGNPTSLVNITKDITERKRLEEQLINSERLMVIGELASSIAHELRNPLGVINNSSYYLNSKLKNVADEKVVKHLKIISKKVNSANIIISDLLDFTKTIKPILKETKISGVIKNALSSVNIPENIEVITELDEIPLMLLDSEQIQRVFKNIIINAVQAMLEGGKLTIQTVKDGDSVNIAFKDTGIGIPKENLGKIFEPLFSTKTTGIGLGLPICKQILGNHDGNITVQSEVSKGSTFIVKLPLHINVEIVR